jgi:UDP-N-acetylmuramate dehydrogenase
MLIMSTSHLSDLLQPLNEQFGERLLANESIARYTSARVGGNADALLSVHSAVELEEAVRYLWKNSARFIILGAGSNILVSKDGFRGVVVVNQARKVRFEVDQDPPAVWAESGASLGVVARQAAGRGLSGFEWAVGIPGTVGGAVVGNAGAHGSDMAQSIFLAEILHHYSEEDGSGLKIIKEQWPVDKLAYEYRSSILKRKPGVGVVLSAALRLEKPGTENIQDIQARIAAFADHRRKTQPPGASMGSMFKNPQGDFAGRLIEAAGLKGLRVGGAEISPLHANFFINHGGASSEDVFALLRKARNTVFEKFGVTLELEIELVGEWDVKNI